MFWAVTAQNICLFGKELRYKFLYRYKFWSVQGIVLFDNLVKEYIVIVVGQIKFPCMLVGGNALGTGVGYGTL